MSAICALLLAWNSVGLKTAAKVEKPVQPPALVQPPLASADSIAILDLDANGVEPTLAAAFSERLRVEFFNTERFRVMERDKMAEILRERNFQLTDYCSRECMQEVGSLLGVGKLVVGSVNKTGPLYGAYLRMIDVRSGQFVKVATSECQCPAEQFLQESSQQAAYRLAGVDYQSPYGSLNVSSEPAGAQVFLDGELKGETPLLLSRLKAGEYQLSLVKENYRMVRKAVQVEAQALINEEHPLERSRGAGSLYIQTLPEAARIQLNGQARGVTPLHVKELAEGTYLLKLQKEGYLPFEKEIQVFPGQLQQDIISLEPQPAPAAGSLSIMTQPAGARVLLGGNEVGQTPWKQDKLSAGAYTLSLQKEGFEPVNEVVQVSEGQATAVEREMKALPNTWWIWAVLGGTVLVAAGGTAAYFLWMQKEQN